MLVSGEIQAAGLWPSLCSDLAAQRMNHVAASHLTIVSGWPGVSTPFRGLPSSLRLGREVFAKAGPHQLISPVTFLQRISCLRIDIIALLIGDAAGVGARCHLGRPRSDSPGIEHVHVLVLM